MMAKQCQPSWGNANALKQTYKLAACCWLKHGLPLT